MTIDPALIFSHTIAFLFGVVLKLLLDFDLAQFLVKNFSWIPVRTIFRRKDIPLAGIWEENWESKSGNYSDPKDRHSHPELKQLGPYCYAETWAKGRNVCVFGKIRGDYLFGTWYDKNDEKRSFGVFHLRIVNADLLNGLWLGHATNEPLNINADTWQWNKLKV
jgi:hypothetical protein